MMSEGNNLAKMNEKTVNMNKSSETVDGANSHIFANFNGNTSIGSSQSLATGEDALYHKNVALFKEFIALCRSIIDCSEDENKKVMGIVQRRFDCAKLSYLASEEFRSFTLSIMEKIRNSNDIFVHILEFSDELYAYKVKKHSREKNYKRNESSQIAFAAKQSHVYDCLASDPCCSKSLPQIPVSVSESLPDIVCVEVNTFKNVSTSPKLNSHNHKGKLPTSVLIDDPATEGVEKKHPSLGEEASKNSDSVDCGIPNRGAKDEMYVKNLEKALKKIHKRIQKLQRKELSLDDLESADSYYLLEERHKKQLVKVWRLLCKYKNRSDKVRYEVERPFHFKGSRYRVINEQMEKFLNKTKQFPDFSDVYKIVETENIRSNLGLSESGGKSVATDIFREIGSEMKHRRMRDYIYLSGCYLTDSIDTAKDPADSDEALQKELNSHAVESEAKLSAIFEKFAQKQEQSKENPTEMPDDGSSPSQSEGEDEEQKEGGDDQILDIALDDESSEDESFSSSTVKTGTMSENLYLNENPIIITPITSLPSMPSLQNEDISKAVAGTTGPTSLPQSIVPVHKIMTGRKIKPIYAKNVACKLKTNANSTNSLAPDGNNNIKTDQVKLPVSDPVKPLGITQIQDLDLMNADKVINPKSCPLSENSITQSDIENSAVNVEKPTQTFDSIKKASITVDEIWLSSDSDIDTKHSTVTDSIKRESLNSEHTSILKFPNKHDCTKSSLSQDTKKRPSHFLKPRSDKKHAKKLCLSVNDE